MKNKKLQARIEEVARRIEGIICTPDPAAMISRHEYAAFCPKEMNWATTVDKFKELEARGAAFRQADHQLLVRIEALEQGLSQLIERVAILGKHPLTLKRSRNGVKLSLPKAKK